MTAAKESKTSAHVKSSHPYTNTILAGILMSLVLWAILRITTPLSSLSAYLVTMNFIAFAAMGYDKQAALKQASRTPELVLGLWALLGGTVGTFAAMKCFRHKTQKARFQMIMAVVLVVQIIALQQVVEVLAAPASESTFASLLISNQSE